MRVEQKTGKTGYPCEGTLETESDKGVRSVATLETARKNGAGSLLLRSLMGHKKSEETDGYVHALPLKQAEQMKKIEGIVTDFSENLKKSEQSPNWVEKIKKILK